MSTKSPPRPVVVTATLHLIVLTLLLPGCSQRIPTSIEVYAEPGGSHYTDGNLVYDGASSQAEKTGTCSSSAQYEAHIDREAGSVTVTVSDEAGTITSFPYAESTADSQTLAGRAGTWTLHVEWTGFVGAIHAGLTC